MVSARARMAIAAALVTALAATAPAAQGRTLRLGSGGLDVRHVQERLVRLHYLPARAVDGSFDITTWHAVVAFQGWSHRTRDGVVDRRTRRAMERARPPVPWSRRTGIEVHIASQVLLLVHRGRAVRAVHVSTGGLAPTPTGHFHILNRSPMSWSLRFHVWMPLAQYFTSGYALHEFFSVPAFPASHGCVRVPEPFAPTVWRFGRVGMRVWIR